MGSRVVLDGPDAELTLGAAQGIGRALHELGTNAAKYGALSNDSGTVLIRGLVTKGATTAFSILSFERHGPKVGPRTGVGSGQTLIGRLTQASVQAAGEIHFSQANVSWSLKAAPANVLTRYNPSRT